MEFPRPRITITTDGKAEEFDIVSLDEFRERRGVHDLSNQTIDNHIKRNSLDFTTIGRFRYIIWNEKAKRFSLAYQKPIQA